MDNGINLTLKPVAVIAGEFFVPSYQRGYRWSDKEVKRLLEDVYANREANYCLQPVVVCQKDDKLELVDGQQRLTTIYLIYKYIREYIKTNISDSGLNIKIPVFTLKYETREETAEYLKTVNAADHEKNIDFWFIYKAFEEIKKWFENCNKSQNTENEEERKNRIKGVIKEICDCFENKVKVIWYEVGTGTDAVSLFERLNIGRIPLTNAELVKAMFLSEQKNITNEMPYGLRGEIALQWDNIEKDLSDDSFWYFLTSNGENQYATRIDIVLDLISEKKDTDREKYYTFLEFEKNRNDGCPMEKIWEEIQQTFLILKDWYEDHDYYHQIGYLITSKSKKLQDVYKLFKGEKNKKDKKEIKSKSEFRKLLNEGIKKSIAINSNNGKSYSELRYDNSYDHDMLEKLLLLFNVETVRQYDKKTRRFPFDKYNWDGKDKVTWSLEHIHAQQSEGLRTLKSWHDWLEDHLESIKSISGEKGNQDLMERMGNAIKKSDLSFNEFELIQKEVVTILSESGNNDYLHTISNLALLNTKDNAALSNSTFDVKRNKIRRKYYDDKEYIPDCTKMVFWKSYTPSKDNQVHFWGKADRDAYVKEINKVLKDYLSVPISFEKENNP